MTTGKKILYGALLIGGLVLLVPQLLRGEERREEVVLEELPADGGEAPSTAGAARPSAGGSPAPAGSSSGGDPDGEVAGSFDPGAGREPDPFLGEGDPEGDPEEAAPEDLTHTLERSLRLIGDLLPSHDAQDLNSLANAWSAVPPEDPASAHAPLVTEVGLPGEGAGDEGPEPGSEAGMSFAEEHPLGAIIRGDRRAVALMGDRVVCEGEEVAPGVRVEAIESRAVMLRSGESLLRVDLPPFRPRLRKPTGSSAGGDGSSAGEGGDGGGGDDGGGDEGGGEPGGGGGGDSLDELMDALGGAGGQGDASQGGGGA